MKTEQTAHQSLSRAARDSERLLVRLAGLQRSEGDTEPEQDALREAMEHHWYAATRSENDLLDDLSADLYLIDAEERPAYQTPSPERQDEIQHFLSPRASRDWDEYRAFLREHAAEIPPAHLLYAMSRLWEERGFPEAALAFAAEAHRLRE